MGAGASVFGISLLGLAAGSAGGLAVGAATAALIVSLNKVIKLFSGIWKKTVKSDSVEGSAAHAVMNTQFVKHKIPPTLDDETMSDATIHASDNAPNDDAEAKENGTQENEQQPATETDFRDVNVKDWFEARAEELGQKKGQQIAVWFAARCAMRVFALVGVRGIRNKRRIKDTLWAITILRVAGNNPNLPVLVLGAVSAAVDDAAAVVGVDDNVFDGHALSRDNVCTAAAAFVAATAATASATIATANNADLAWLHNNKYNVYQSISNVMARCS